VERTIWWDGDTVVVIDQTRLPQALIHARWTTLEDAAHGIEAMQVRGAPLIGVAAAHGVALALREDASDDGLAKAVDRLRATRPTAVNLAWALDRCDRELAPLAPSQRVAAARDLACALAAEDAETCRAVGLAGLPALSSERRPVQVLTHCNAGWLATVEWGTALAPVYLAHVAGVPVHVWVSETRPRNQGAALTAWELGRAGVPHTVVVDNACGQLMRNGMVHVCLVGADRIAANGDVANKVGTYLKALAAHDCGVPFYVLAPTSTIDHFTSNGAGIPIEERDPSEVLALGGVGLAPEGATARNWAFDVTPARLITGIITERGLVPATVEGIASLR
jgi:methylthioribose-1-phosphate isomerase